MNPTSRGGGTHEFNLFPFKLIRHNCWHKIFLNMTIWEVWEYFNQVHEAIFNSDKGLLNRHWLLICKLPSKTDLQMQIERNYSIKDLRDTWVCAFGGRKYSRAKKFLQYMILFMIFGSDMAYPKKLFNDDNLKAFFREFPFENEREWAFKTCFGDGVDTNDLESIKRKISEVLRLSP